MTTLTLTVASGAHNAALFANGLTVIMRDMMLPVIIIIGFACVIKALR